MSIRLSTMYNNSLVNSADCVARCFANSPYVAKRAMATRTIHDRFFVFADFDERAQSFGR